MASGYQWRATARYRKTQDPNEFAAQLRAMKTVTPEAVVAANRAKGSVMHEAITWDDAEAAAAFRRHQATKMLSQLMLGDHRAYLPVGDGSYARWSELLNRQSYRHKTISHFFRDLETLKLKYDYLPELKAQFRALDELLRHKPEKVGA